MGTKVHFLGIEISEKEIRISLLNRKENLVATTSETISPAEETENSFVYNPFSWARQISALTRELVESSEIPAFKIWGYATVASPGWICLDTQGDPLSKLHTSKPGVHDNIIEDINSFLDSDNRFRPRLGFIFSPKDFLRFHWSKVIATDISDAINLGLLRANSTNWSPEKLTQYKLNATQLPPIFRSTFACGRVGTGGAEATGLQNSAWIAIGSNHPLSRITGCGSLNTPTVYLLANDPSRYFWCGPELHHGHCLGPALDEKTFLFSGKLDTIPPEIFTGDTPIILDWLHCEDSTPIIKWARDSGRPVFTSPFSGEISPGPAILAALSSGMFPSPKTFFKKFRRPNPL